MIAKAENFDRIVPFLESILARHAELDLTNEQLAALTRIYWSRATPQEPLEVVEKVASVLSASQFQAAVAHWGGSSGATSDQTKTRIDELVAAAIAMQSKDKRLIEVEIATKIAERMTSWVKTFGFFLAAPAALVLILLGIIGISKFQDVQTAASA